MKTVNTIQEVREIVRAWRTEGQTVGFVPTMGYLHEGHQSLIHRAVKENDRVVVSIFINPMQFGKKEDFGCYPKDLEQDKEACALAGADILFYPSQEEMYPDGFCSYVDMDGLTNILCGESRPAHFRGVCTVVIKLVNIVRADRAYFGQKDAQQVAVIKRMVSDLNIDIEIVDCETVREPDGLAKSSRNVYLNQEERRASIILQEALQLGKQKILDGERTPASIMKTIRDKICTEDLAILDYAEMVDLDTLKPIKKINSSVLVAAAVYIGKTRLIDNFIYKI